MALRQRPVLQRSKSAGPRGYEGHDSPDSFQRIACFGSVDCSSDSIVITFSESMDTEPDCTIGGTLPPIHIPPLWSTTTAEDDTLTISPSTT